MYSRLATGFKSNCTLLKEVSSTSHTSSRRSDSNSSRRSDTHDTTRNHTHISSRQETHISSRQQTHCSRPKAQENFSTHRESTTELLGRFVSGLERVIDQYTDLPVMLKGELTSILRLGRRISQTCGINDKENQPSHNTFRRESKDKVTEKMALLDRLRTQSQLQLLMEKLVKSKDKRVKLAEQNFCLRVRIEEQSKEHQGLSQMVESQKQLIESCLKEMDSLRMGEKSVDMRREEHEDLLGMITLQAQELEKMLKKDRVKR